MGAPELAESFRRKHSAAVCACRLPAVAFPAKRSRAISVAIGSANYVDANARLRTHRVT